MKKLLFIATAALGMFSCVNEPIQEPGIEDVSVSSAGELSGKCYSHSICFFTMEKGYKLPGAAPCVPSKIYNCDIPREVCIPIFDCIIPSYDWWFDVWEVARLVNPDELYSLPAETGITPRKFMPGAFAVSDHIMAFQYLEKQPEMSDDGTFLVNTPLDLSREVAQQFGRDAAVIKAGRYPVVYSNKHDTYNAFLNVDTYPYQLDSRLAFADYYWKDEYIHEILEGLEPETARDGAVNQQSDGYELDIPDQKAGVYFFSSNGENLVMSVKGAGVSPFSRLILEKPLMLDEKIARAAGIEPFLLQPDYMTQQIDRENGTATVAFFKP